MVSLNEECGLIQWVPNTIPVRNILTALYARRGMTLWVSDVLNRHSECMLTTPQNQELRAAFDKVKGVSGRDAAEVFVKEVLDK